MHKQIEQTITTLEIAEMMEVPHYSILEKLEGTKKPDGSVKQVGIIPTLTNQKILVSDYFIPSTYKDASGKENRCYKTTKIGCEFLANKFTGEKGIIFTARYVKRFNDMENAIKKGISQKRPERDDTRKVQIPSSVNTAAKILKDTYADAGVDPKFIAVAVGNLYKESTGYDSGIPLISEDAQLYDKTSIAEKFGICSKSGKPHPQAVGAIISQLEVAEDECVNTPYNRHGHSGVDVQYKESVCDKVERWLELHDYPDEIMSESGKKLKVNYHRC